MTTRAGCGRTLVFATRGGRRDIATTPSCCSHNRHRKASDRRSGWDANRLLSPGTSRPVTHRALAYSALSRRRGVRRLDSHARGYGLRLALAIHAGTSGRPTRPSTCSRVPFVPAPDRRSGGVPLGRKSGIIGKRGGRQIALQVDGCPRCHDRSLSTRGGPGVGGSAGFPTRHSARESTTAPQRVAVARSRWSKSRADHRAIVSA